MTTTANLGLNLPEGSDYADIAALNANFQKIDAAMAAAKSAEEYNSAGIYAVGNYCTHEGKLYKCTTAITAAEAWNAAHWAETTVAGEFAALYTALAGKAAVNHTHTPAQLGAAAASHNHDASAITSGILPAARGGTGVSSLAALASALGAAKSVIGTYQGTDLAGFNNKTSITLPFAPKLLIVDGMRPVDGGKWYGCLVFCFFTSSSACTVFNGSTSEEVNASISGNTISWYANYDSSTYAQRSQSGTHYCLAIG